MGIKTNPKFSIKRISRGNEHVFRENEQTDEITIYANVHKPSIPIPVSPKGEIAFRGGMLNAEPFISAFENAYHAASHWQISTAEDFSKLVLDSWKQSENWYYNEDRQKDDDLTDEPTKRLKPGTDYYWRVRYRDQNLNWSDWSQTATFKTKEQ